MAEHLGITTAEKGILTRLVDKVARISNLLDRPAEVKDESIFDTLDDLANYAIILKLYLKDKREDPWTEEETAAFNQRLEGQA